MVFRLPPATALVSASASDHLPAAAPGHNAGVALLNPWQRGFPLQREPFRPIAQQAGLSEPALLQACAALQHDGRLSRIGGVFAAAAGGAALLAAFQVPTEQLLRVAALVSAHPGVNHNYEREHAYNLWFVLTGRDAPAVALALDSLERATGLRALRLPLLRPYRIDLGFDLRQRTAGAPPLATSRPHRPAAIAAKDVPLAALVEEGLPLLARPYDAWAQALGRSPEQVLARLQDWLDDGQLRRFGFIVRHHELGFAANAMTVFDVPDDQVDAFGAALARQPGITLAYRRHRAAGWPYNLYCMVHGSDRGSVQTVLDEAVACSGLAPWPRAVLFSRRRFKQTGARRFRDLMAPWTEESAHALA